MLSTLILLYALDTGNIPTACIEYLKLYNKGFVNFI